MRDLDGAARLAGAALDLALTLAADHAPGVTHAPPLDRGPA